MASDKELLNMHLQGVSHKEIAAHYKLDVAGVRGRISGYKRGTRGRRAAVIEDDSNPLVEEIRQLRAQITEMRDQLNEQEDERLYGHDLGKPMRFEGDAITVGDVHLNTTLMRLFERLLAVAQAQLKPPRRLILAGDIINADAFSHYPTAVPLPSFANELKAVRAFLEQALAVFDEIDIFLGNHDRRVQKATNTAISPEDLLRMVSHDPRVKISHWGHCILHTPRGDYRITHGSEYSVNQLVVADQLAQKYGQHIISWHEHHCAIGLDRFKKYTIVNGGGLFDQDSMAYTQLDDSKKPRMANGFVMIKNGYPHLFSDAFTDWSLWIDEKPMALKKVG